MDKKIEKLLKELENKWSLGLKYGINDEGEKVALESIEKIDNNIYVYRYASKPYIDPAELKEKFIGETIEDVKKFLEEYLKKNKKVKYIEKGGCNG